MSRHSKRSSLGPADFLASVRRPAAIAAVIIVVAVTASYLGAVCNDFVNLDDPRHLELNPYFHPLSWRGLRRLWAAPYFGEYVPLTYTLLAAESLCGAPGASASGSPFDPAVFHAGSLALHVACVWLVFVLLRRLVRSTGAALLGALVFGLHPLQVESVAWVSETRGVLAAFWALLAIGEFLSFAGLRSWDSSGQQGAEISPTHRGLHYGLATCCFVLALLSKPSAVVVPLLAGVLAWGYLRDRRRVAALGLLPWLLIAAVFAIVTKASQSDQIIGFVTPLAMRPLIAGDALAFYLGKLVWPDALSLHYDRSPQSVLQTGWIYCTWLAPAALLAATLWRQKLRPYVPAVAMWMAGLAPVLGLVPFGFQDYSTVADRYMNLPLLGAALAVAVWAAGRRGALAPVVIGGLLLIFAALSHAQVAVWRDSPTLWDHTLRVNPRSWMAHFNRGVWRRDSAQTASALGRPPQEVQRLLDEAMSDLDQAAALYPRGEFAAAHVQRASIYQLRGDQARALAEYDQAIQADPRDMSGWYNRGLTRMGMQEHEQAIADLTESIALSPEFAEPLLPRGYCRQQLGRLDAAVEDFSRFIEMRPADPAGYVRRAEALSEQGQIPQAVADLTTALGLTKDAQLHERRARLHVQLGDFARARSDLQAVREAGKVPDAGLVRAVERGGK